MIYYEDEIINIERLKKGRKKGKNTFQASIENNPTHKTLFLNTSVEVNEIHQRPWFIAYEQDPVNISARLCAEGPAWNLRQ